MNSDDSFSDLLCYEDPSFLFENEEFVYEENIEDNSFSLGKEELVYEDYLTVYDEECVQMLFDKETSFGFNKNASLMLSDSLKHDRSEAITLILKKREILGLHFQTAYVSVMYFDRYISKTTIDTRPMQLIPEVQLLSMSCLFLATKMEETKGPSIAGFRTEECFLEDIRRKEASIVKALNWKMRSITPFDFLHFFTTKLCKESSQDHMSQTAPLILAVMREINLMEYRPSVIAAAATLMTMDQNFTRNALESTMNSISDCPVIELEDVYTCYGLMQKLDATELNIPNSEIAPDKTPIHLNESLYDSRSSASIGAKRKGLTFIKSDNNDDSPDKKRQY